MIPVVRTYAVKLRLNERGAQQLRYDTGRNWLDDMEVEEEIDAASVEELEEIVEQEWGTLLSYRLAEAPTTLPMGVVDANTRRSMGLAHIDRAEPARGSRLLDLAVLVGVYVLGFAVVAWIAVAGRARRVANRLTPRRRVRLEPDVLDALSRRVSRRPKGMQ